MTLATLRFLWCDAEGCDEEFGPEPVAARLREAARESGWRRVNGLDFCPDHASHIGRSEQG